ncbi:MAG TPA: FAD-dependent oxidoreductase [Candidatus Limnocylindrales bacterium]|nr:FAD-dependent oxidoreductase [Candidatus Limnocylindrales bacterium]
MAKVEIIIDGKEVFAEEGSNLLEVALQNGIVVPHLCYDPRIKPFGSCRMCFVDIGGPKGPVPACATEVTPGMKVVTDNAALTALRKVALELLMSEHCGDCIAPCQIACPAHIDIQGYIAFIDRGEYKKAADLIKEKMPLPSICGRVCPRFCEIDCRRQIVDEPVNICDLKRFAGDFDLKMINSYAPLAKEDTGKEVAVVGGGPAGLTAAYYLALEGHRVTLFDRGPRLGGMLRYGIPEYRLPKDLLDQEVDLIAGLCREVHLGEVFGSDFTLENLKEKYDAVFLGLGSQSSQGMGLEKEDTPGILRGIDFLRIVVEGNPPELGRRVAVVGGGNTAMDAARTALRLGVDEVNVIYRRSRDEMPANPVEIEEALEEGIKFHYLTNPVAVLGGECVAGLECIKMELGEPDASGRRRPLAVKGSEFQLELDNVIMAIGQSLDLDNAQACGLIIDGNTLAASTETGCTPMEGVFTAGDAVTGPATVVEAVGAARRAAHAMNLYLKGLPVTSEKNLFNCTMGKLDQLTPEDFADQKKIARVKVHHLAPLDRKQDFREYNLGLAEDEMGKETKRCLSCGCQDAFTCTLRHWATEFAISTDQLGVEQKRYPISKDHPYVQHDPNKCILCANCVRICQEVQGANALCLVNRGYDTVVKPYLELPLSDTTCESDGQCVSACPTGALIAKGSFAKPGPWKDDRVVRTTCVQCGIGCILDLHIVAEIINRVTSPLRQKINDGNLCVKGSFRNDFVHSPDRLYHPMVKNGTTMKEVGWEEAIAVAAAGLTKVKKDFGADSIAVLVSPTLSNEESYLARQLARQVLGTSNIAGTNPIFGGAKPKVRFLSYEEVTSADFVLAIDSDLPEDYPIIAQKVRVALENGAKLALISSHTTRLDQSAALIVPVSPGKILGVLKGLLGYMVKPGQKSSLSETEISETFVKLREALWTNPSVLADLAVMLSAAHRPVVIVDGQKVGAAELAVLEEVIALVAGNDARGGILPLCQGGNTMGQLLVGMNTDPDSAGKADKSETRTYNEILEAARQGKIKGMFIVGDGFPSEVANVAPEIFTTALVSILRDDLRVVDVMLPAATFAETRGTVVNCEGRVQELNQAFQPPAGKENWEILIALAAASGKPFEAVSIEKLLSETVAMITA